MFAPKLVRPQTKVAQSATNRAAQNRSVRAGRPPGYDAPERTSFLQSTQAGLEENASTEPVPRGVSWDLTSVPLFSPEATGHARQAIVQARLAVGPVDDPLEREADHVAEQVMRMPVPRARFSPAAPQISRKCAACQEEDKNTLLQTKPNGPAMAHREAPPIVHEVIGTSGQPLDANTRAFFEPKFRRDFSGIRVHADHSADVSARELGARAYTVANHVVFAAGQFAPATNAGQTLLAHELTHSIQQAGRTGQLARACLPDAICKAPESTKGSQDQFVKDTEAKPENVTKKAHRDAACKNPASAACSAGGHGRRAVELSKFLAAVFPARVAAIHGLFVDMDIPDAFGAYTFDCSSFTPPVAGGAGKECTFVPNGMETEAAQYNKGAATVGGTTRRTWSQEAQRRLTHETEHALFTASIGTPGGVKDAANPCNFDAITSDLTELAAIINEFQPVHHKALGIKGAARQAELDNFFKFWIEDGSENIAGSLRDIRCKCDCEPAKAYIIRMYNFASGGWTTYEKWLYNTTLRDPKWKLDWPVMPPASVPVDQLPNAGVTADVADLPKATK